MYKVYINSLLVELTQHSFAISIIMLSLQSPSFADDISLLATYPTFLSTFMNLCYEYIIKWRYGFYLLTTSGPRGTFSRLSTKRGCISIIKLPQFTVVPSFWASLGEALFQKACHQDAIKRRKTHNCVGKKIF